MPQLTPEQIAAAQSIPAMVGQAEPDYELMADAMYKAEGGMGYNYGVKSVKFKDEAEARRIAINTAKNNYRRWQEAGKPGAYYEFMANRYTPVASDPKGNANWKVNVPVIYAQLLAQQEQPTEVPKGYVRSVMPNYKL